MRPKKVSVQRRSYSCSVTGGIFLRLSQHHHVCCLIQQLTLQVITRRSRHSTSTKGKCGTVHQFRAASIAQFLSFAEVAVCMIQEHDLARGLDRRYALSAPRPEQHHGPCRRCRRLVILRAAEYPWLGIQTVKAYPARGQSDAGSVRSCLISA